MRICGMVVVCLVLVFAIIVFATPDEPDMAREIAFESEANFTGLNDENVVVPPGSYNVELTNENQLILENDVEDRYFVLKAKAISHKEAIDDPTSFVADMDSGEIQLVYFVPSGEGFIAVGFLTESKTNQLPGGVTERGSYSYVPATPKIPSIPKITRVSLNNGASTTSTRDVTLYITAENASRYRASEFTSFYGATWKTLQTGQPFTLSSGNGTKTVYVQVKNTSGQLSSVATDAIDLVLPAPSATKEFKIGGWKAYTFAKYQGFSFSAIDAAPLSSCTISKSEGGNLLLKCAGDLYLNGGTCDFVLFGNRQLAEGWTFKEYFFLRKYTTGGDYSLVERPEVGGRSIRFKFHVWDEKGRYEIHFMTLTLIGPADAEWRDAFR